MAAIRSLLARREARAAIVVWAVLPSLFLFFSLTLAVDPAAHVDRMRMGAVVLDQGVETPDGTVAIGPRLVAAVGQKAGFEVAAYPSEAALRQAVLDRDVVAGIVVPAGLTAGIQAGQPVTLEVVRSDANDPFSNAFSAGFAAQLESNVAGAVAALQAGASPAEPGAPGPAVSVAAVNVAPSPDFRFATLPATLVLPVWVATLALAVLLARAAREARAAAGAGRGAAAELLVAALGAALAAAVITLDVALFAWRSDFDVVALFGVLWLGLWAVAWLLQGTIRLLGLGAGAAVGVLALFLQQPVSGAAFPSAFAPDAVRWLEPVAPIGYLLEGVRNALVGGTSSGEIAIALAAFGAAGLVLFGAGEAVSGARARRRHAVVAPAA